MAEQALTTGLYTLTVMPPLFPPPLFPPSPGYYESVHNFHRRQLAPDELRLVRWRARQGGESGRRMAWAGVTAGRLRRLGCQAAIFCQHPRPSLPGTALPSLPAGARLPRFGAGGARQRRQRGRPHPRPNHLSQAAPAAAAAQPRAGAAVRGGVGGAEGQSARAIKQRPGGGEQAGALKCPAKRARCNADGPAGGLPSLCPPPAVALTPGACTPPSQPQLLAG